MATGGNKQATAAKTVVLDTARLAPFEIGARLDAMLCYPKWSFEKQQRIADAICAEVVARWITVDPSLRTELWAAYPRYKKGQSRASLQTLLNRRYAAMIAGRAMLPLLKKSATGELPILSGKHRELSIAEIARVLWPDQEKGFEANYDDRLHDHIRERIRSFYPVAHLVATYQLIAHQRSGVESAATFDYQDLDFHREIVHLANEFSGYFASLPKWESIARGLIAIEWRE